MKTIQGLKVAAFIGSMIVSAGLTGCSATVSTPDVQIPAIPGGSTHVDDFAHLIQGPSVDGTWRSKCVPDSRQENRWDLIVMSVSGQNVTRMTQWFNDAACLESAGSKNEIGRFRYTKKNSLGDFEVEYEFMMQNGTYTQYETYNLKNQALYVSNEIGGEGSANVPMTKDLSVEMGPSPQTIDQGSTAGQTP